jgi:hypothetical protein
MARKIGIANYNTFVQGLITEASPLTYPENASLDEANFELQRNGSRYRRLGIDYENHYEIGEEILAADVYNRVFMSYDWRSAGNRGGNDFAVVQSGESVFFFSMESESISRNKADFSINLEDFISPSSTLKELRFTSISVAQVKGNLIIASPSIDTLFVRYDPDAQTLSVSKITVQVRDFLGLNDGFEIDHRPTSGEMNAAHYYNLYNQGWSSTNVAAYFSIKSVYPSNADIMSLGKKADDTFDPTLLDLQFFGNSPAPRGHFIHDVLDKKYTDLSFSQTLVPSSLVYDEINGTLTISTSTAHGLVTGGEVKLNGVSFSLTYDIQDDETKAVVRSISRDIRPEDDTLNGHYFKVVSVPNTTTIVINWSYDTTSLYRTSYTWTGGGYNAINKAISLSGGRLYYNVASDIVDEITEDKRFSAVGGYAGRAWYSGIDSGQYSSYVFYSKILERPEYVGQCYQEADPASEHNSDLVDTDGGFIIIPEMNRCQSIVPMGANLFVFADNGVWKISGIDGTFTATSYRVDKVSSVGVWGKHTIVPVETHIFYWAKGGIYMLEASEISQEFTSKNISNLSIQTLFNSIPDAAKIHVKGTYDPTTKVIEWLVMNDPDYANSILEGTVTPTNYNMMLRFDTILSAWYKYEFDLGSQNGKPFIADSVTTPDVISLSSTLDVLVGTDEVVVGTDTVNIVEVTNRSSIVQTKYLTVGKKYPTSYMGNHILTFSNFKNSEFVDWYSYDNAGYDFESYLITGYSLFDQQALKKQAHYLMMFFERTESGLVETSTGAYPINPSSCYVRVAWDWANSSTSGKWGSEFQAYRIPRLYYSGSPTDTYDYGENVITSKSTLRGRGRSLSLRIRSESGKDLKLHGWSLVVSEEEKP